MNLKARGISFIRKPLAWILKQLSNLEFLLLNRSINPVFGKWWASLSGFEFQGPLALGHEIYVRNFGKLHMGAFCSLGSFTRIWNYSDVIIGDYFLGAGELTINTATHDPSSLENSSQPVTIGKRVWVGQKVTILSGVCIGDDVVIAAGSIVTCDLASNSIYGGVPAKRLKGLDRTSAEIENVEKDRQDQFKWTP
jgi:acetyltransferase-like isoleucine patch superfamily enzyme